MKILLIDSTSSKSFIAICDGHNLSKKIELNDKQQSNEMMPLLAKLLKQESIDAIAAGVGPGSYTGIRVGATVAKTLSFTWNIPLIGISSLECYKAKQNNEQFVSMLDARIGGVYACEYKNAQVKKAALYKPQEAILLLKTSPLVLSPDCDKLKARFLPLLSDKQTKWEESSPCLKTFYSQAKKAFNSGDFSTDGSLNLLYLRKTEAEMNKS